MKRTHKQMPISDDTFVLFVILEFRIYTRTHGCLTHWGPVTHICLSKLTIIGSNNGLSPGRHQAIIWTNAGILLIAPLGTNFREMFNKILYIFMHFKMSSAKWRSFWLGLNVLRNLYKLGYREEVHESGDDGYITLRIRKHKTNIKPD